MPAEPATPARRDSTFPMSLGKYTPFARLGSGGMAEVFLSVARGPVGFNKLAVIKRLKNPDDATHVQMFLDEARLAARLSHPNVVHTYEVGQSGGKYFIAMEYLEGQSLQTLLSKLTARQSGLGEVLVAYVAAQALRGLHHAHELCDFDGTPLRIIHRDVSPHNLHLTYGGLVKLLDFGIAKAAMNATHTEAGVIKGKIRYMAPEQIADRAVDRRADIFAFGVVLWELLARRPLFQGDAAAVLSRIVNQDVEPARAVRPEAPADLDRIALKALHRDPDARYATAEEMRIAVEECLRARGPWGPEGTADKQLAQLMNDVFASTRDEVRGRIKAFLATVPPEADDEQAPASARTNDLPVLVESSGSHTPPAMSGLAVVTPRPTSRWRWLLLAVCTAFGTVMLLGRLGRNIQPPTPSASGSPPVLPLSGPPLGSMPAETPDQEQPSATPPVMACPAASSVPPATCPPPPSISAVPAPVVARPVMTAAIAASVATGHASAHPVTLAAPAASSSSRPQINIRALDE